MPRPLTTAQALALVAELRRDAKQFEALARAIEIEVEAGITIRADRLAGLRPVNIGGKVNTSMHTEHRVAISEGRTPKNPFMAKVQKAGFTLRSLAGKLGVPVSLLSMYRAKGGRPIPRDRAERIAKLTGWPADAAHWPNNFA